MRNKDIVYVRQFMGSYYLATKANATYGPSMSMSRQEWRAHRPAKAKLPKQWKHWCKDSKLKIYNNWRLPSNMAAWSELRGRGHVWRVGDNGMFQLGDNYDEFHYWDISTIDETILPQTREQFRNAVKNLLSQRMESAFIQD